MSRPVVAIVIPSGDMVHAAAAYRLPGIIATATVAGIAAAVINPQCSLVVQGRNNGVAAALARKASHVLFLDSDMVVPFDVVQRLVAHGKDIVGATYCRRTPPFLFNHQDEGCPDGEHIGTIGRDETGLRSVKSLATGCMLIAASVFQRVRLPWFRTPHVDGVHDITGEDYYFCWEARKAGIDIWLDCGLSREVEHLGTHPVTLADGWQWHELSQKAAAP